MADPPQVRHPYAFRGHPSHPPTLYSISTKLVLGRYIPKPFLAKRVFPKLTRKADLDKARRQLTKYFNLLNDLIKADLVEVLFNYRWDTYRQKHRTILDKDMLDNDLCCTYPEECSGRHNLDLAVSNLEFVMVWKILVGKSATNLNLLPFLDQYHNSIMVQVLTLAEWAEPQLITAHVAGHDVPVRPTQGDRLGQ